MEKDSIKHIHLHDTFLWKQGDKAFRKIFLLGRWIVMALITGIVVGGFATLFAKCMNYVTTLRTDNPYIILALPLAGIIIVGLYRLTNSTDDRGTNLVISSISSQDDIPFKMAPLIFVSTVLTHLCGGSAGREGAALQLGGSIGNFIGKIFKIDDNDRKVIIMCGMSAAFSALFGTPMAAAIFSVEVVSVGVMYYSALVPCIVASLLATRFASDMGIRPEHFTIVKKVDFSIPNAGKTIILAIICAAVSVLFCLTMKYVSIWYKKYLKNGYVRVVVASLLIIGLSALLQTTDYLGAGVNVIDRAVSGDASTFDFLLKIVFTALTLGAGFKGGEIVPSFFIGATLGCVFGQIAGISPSLCAAVGMVSVFCGVTNCPITSLLISFELFGDDVKSYVLIAVAISYMMSGYYSLYHDQKIIYSKSKTKYINIKAK